MEPSGDRVAFDTRLHEGKLCLMIREATEVASPFGAAPTTGGAATAGTTVESAVTKRIKRMVGFKMISLRWNVPW